MDSESPKRHREPHEPIEEWEVITTDRCGAKHVIFLSPREEDKNRATFIVVEDGAVCDLLDRR